MNLPNRIRALMPPEKDTFTLCFLCLLALSIGLTQVWMRVSSATLFFQFYPSETLPYIYIGSAAALILTGFIYTVLEKKLAIPTLIKVLITAIAVSYFLFWTAFQAGLAKSGAMLLYIWADTTVDLCEVVLWATANFVFNLRQAKRYFAMIGIAQTGSGIIGGLAAYKVIAWFGLKNIIILPMLLLTIGLLFIQQLLKHHLNQNPAAATSSNEHNQEIHQPLSSLWRKSYLRHLVLFAAIGTYLYFIIDMNFYKVVRAAYPEELAFSKFMGNFYAIIDFIELAARPLILGWLINQYGIQTGLLARPIATLLFVMCLIAVLIVAPVPGLILWLMVAVKLADEGFNAAVQKQAMLILYQPLGIAKRLWFQGKMELLVIPVCCLLAGLTLLLLASIGTVHLLIYSLLSLGLIGAMLVLIKRLYQGYHTALKKAVNHFRSFNFDWRYIDKRQLDLLVTKVKSPYPEEAIFALEKLSLINAAYFLKGLHYALRHPLYDVQAFALTLLLKQPQQDPKLIAQLQKLLTMPTPAALHRLVIRYLLDQKLLPPAELSNYLRLNDLSINQEIIVYCLNNQQQLPGFNAQQVFNQLLSSAHLADKISAAQILPRLHDESYYESYYPLLLSDTAIEVAQTLLSTMRQENTDCNIQLLLAHLDKPELKPFIFSIVSQQGDKALPALTTALTEKSQTPALLKLIAAINTPAAFEVLLSQLTAPGEQQNAQAVLQALVAMDLPIQSPWLTKIENHLAQHIVLLEKIHQLCQTAAPLEDKNAAFALLQRLFSEKQRLAANNILLLLALLYPKQIILNIQAQLFGSDEEKASCALELLDISLKNSHKKLLALLNFQPAADNVKLSSTECLRNIIQFEKDSLFDPLTKAAIIYCIGLQKMTALKSYVNQNSQQSDIIIHETALWTLARLV